MGEDAAFQRVPGAPLIVRSHSRPDALYTYIWRMSSNKFDADVF